MSLMSILAIKQVGIIRVKADLTGSIWTHFPPKTCFQGDQKGTLGRNGLKWVYDWEWFYMSHCFV